MESSDVVHLRLMVLLRLFVIGECCLVGRILGASVLQHRGMLRARLLKLNLLLFYANALNSSQDLTPRYYLRFLFQNLVRLFVLD